jgi:TIR domain
MAHDIFLSYASVDKPIADAAVATLEARGIRCWIAPRDIIGGLDWSAQIVDAVSASRVLVLVFSGVSNESPQVKREVERAVSKGLPVIPFRIEDVPLSKHMEYFISTPHWLDALTEPLQSHLDLLAETVGLLIARASEDGQAPPRRAPRPTPAPKPLRQLTWNPPPELQAYEERFVDAIRPFLRPAEPVLGARPAGGMVAALVVGVLGAWSGLVGLFRVVVPGQGELAIFQAFPLLRLSNLFGSVTGTIGSLALLVAADWMVRHRPGGREVGAAACRLLALTTLLWFVMAVASFGSNWNVASVFGMVPSTLGVAVTAWAMQAVTYYLLRKQPGGATDTPPAAGAPG